MRKQGEKRKGHEFDSAVITEILQTHVCITLTVIDSCVH